MAKRKLIYKESYVKDSVADKKEVLDLIKIDTTKVLAIDSGKYDDETMFMTFKIEFKL